MPSYIKNLFARIAEEDFCYTQEIKRPIDFADEMCHHYPQINDLIMHLQTEWEAAKTGCEEISTYAIDRKDTAGLVIKTGNKCDVKLLHYLIDYIKCQLQNDDYLLSANKHTAERVSGCTQESWFYFLKGKPTFNQEKYVQRYGNVTLELKKDVKNNLQLKIQCTYYTGFNYETPIPFGDFLASL